MTDSRRLRSTGAILHNSQGQILLQLRDDKPGIAFPNHWTTLGGAIEAGESPDEAIRRELLEEINMRPELRLWKVFDNSVHWGTLLMIVEQHLYVGEIDCSADEIRLNEGQAVRFFGLDDLDNTAIAFGFESVFRAFFEEIL